MIRRVLMSGLAAAAVFLPLPAAGQPQVSVTVTQLIRSDHQLEVEAGTEVLWADAHFERIWFPPGSDAPRVERAPVGFRTRFDRPGTYRGNFTVAGGYGSPGPYPLIVTVKPRKP